MGSKMEIEKIYALSPMQEGILFHSLLSNNLYNYFEQFIINIEGTVDSNLLQKSLNILIERYDVLRTVFIYKESQKPRQVVLKERPATIFYKDISTFNLEQKSLYINEYKKKDIDRGFDVSKDQLIRLALIQTSEFTYTVIFSFHHIIIDGWSFGIITKELFHVYESLKNKSSIKLSDTYSFQNYVKWVNEQDRDSALSFWGKYLEGYEQAATLPKYGHKIQKNYFVQNVKEFYIEGNLFEKLILIAKENNVTFNTVIQTIWGILLQKYNNNNDAIFGSVVSGRSNDINGIERMVGLFINTVPIRIKSEQDTTFSQLLQNVQQSLFTCIKYSYLQLVDIQACTTLKQSLLNHILIFENYYVEETINDFGKNKILGFKIKNIEEFEQTNYDFNIVIIPADKLHIQFKYNMSIYDNDIVERIQEHFIELIRNVANNPNLFVKDLECISTGEKTKVLYEFNSTYTDYERNSTIHKLFEMQTQKTPELIAANYKCESISYKELNQKANQVASFLREKGVKPDDIIGVMVKRSLNILVAILGVLKAGGAYLPIDPSYPRERINYMLKDSGANIVLTYGENSNELGDGLDVIDITDIKLFSVDNTSNLEKFSATAHNLAYVIYTSGSTGNPKGVMIEHKSVCNFINGIKRSIDFKTGKTILALTTICFDIFVLETLLPLTCGMKIIIADEMQQKDPEEISSLIMDNKVDMLQLTPSRLQLLLNGINDLNSKNAFRCFNKLEEIMVGGEAFPESLLVDLKKLTKAKIYNLYGPTETTVWSSLSDLTESKSINIGKPIANTQIYIVDKYYNAQPVGIPGELCIAGDGLARGYLNKPELTDEKFVLNPFIEGKKMYRTGDVAKWLPNGELDCMGRLDNQVKVRGFRIELGEIEEKLMGHSLVKNAAVVVRTDENSEKYLCAYYTGELELTTAELRGSLSKDLPDYMIPSYFMYMDKMPLTPNGKVNRRELPEVGAKLGPQEKYIAPANKIEEKLAEIWSEILGIENIGVEHNLFELGGHSLKAMLIINRINKEFNSDISLGRIFETPTIRGISKHLIVRAQADIPALKPVEEREYYDLSSAQKRMYIIDNLFEAPTISYNMPAVILLEGSLNRQRLEIAFKNLLKRHEALRTSFDFVEFKPVQRIHKEVPFNLVYMEEEQNKLEEMIREFVKPFDLTKAPLYRAVLIKHGEDMHTLLIDMHHIISDGTSLGIMYKDLVDLYKGNELLELNIQYKDFSVWHNELLKSQVMKKEEEYWLNVFSGSLPVLNMPTDYPRPEVISFDGDRYRYILDRTITSKIYELQAKTGTTLYMLLLAVYSILLSKYSAQEDIVIGTPVLGRQHPDLEKVMGVFVNTLAMRNYPKSEKTFIEFLGEVKANSLKAFENQDYQFEELVQKLGRNGDMSRNPLFSTMLTLQNMSFPHIELAGLKFVPSDYSFNISIFDLSLFVWEEEGTLKIIFEYNTKLFKRETVEKLAAYMTRILEQLVNDNYVKLKDICMLDGEKGLSRKHQLNPGAALLLYKGSEADTDLALAPKSKQEEILLEVWKKVLNLNTIGLRDSFFKLGGDSIKAIQVVAELRTRGYSIQVMHIFKYQTIRVIASCMNILKPAARQDGMDSDDLFYKGFTPEAFADFVKFLPQQVAEPVEILNIYPVLPSQERMLFFSLFYKNSTAYFDQIIIDFEGTVDTMALEKSLNMVIEKHEVLRSVFFYKKAKQPIQVILKERTAKLEYIDIGNYGQEEQRIFIDELKASDRKKNFNLSKDLLLRLRVLKVGKGSYKLLWSHHHIILDGWSFYIVLLDLFKIYCSVIHGKTLKQDEAYTYCEYLRWLESRNREEALNYWKEKLREYSYKPLITNYKNKLNSKVNDNRCISTVLNSELTKKVINAAKMHDVTLNNMFQVLWGLLLQADTGTDDIVYGVVSSGRPPGVSNINKMVGLFVNVIPLRVKCNEELSLQQVLKQVNGYMAESEEHSYYSMLTLQENLGLKDKNLIDHVMVFENFPVDSDLDQLYKELAPGFVVGGIQYIEQTNYNFNIAVIPGDEILINFYYNAFACEEGYIRELQSRFIRLLEEASVNAEVMVSDLKKIIGRD